MQQLLILYEQKSTVKRKQKQIPYYFIFVTEKRIHEKGIQMMQDTDDTWEFVIDPSVVCKRETDKKYNSPPFIVHHKSYELHLTPDKSMHAFMIKAIKNVLKMSKQIKKTYVSWLRSIMYRFVLVYIYLSIIYTHIHMYVYFLCRGACVQVVRAMIQVLTDKFKLWFVKYEPNLT